MSDEPPPPSLRLRPRARPEDAPPPPAVPVPPVAGEAPLIAPIAPATEPPPRLRLKPKLPADPAAAAPADEPAVAPAATVTPAMDDTTPRLRLAPKPAVAPEASVDAVKDLPSEPAGLPALKLAPVPPPVFDEPSAVAPAPPPKMAVEPPSPPLDAAKAEAPAVAPLPAFHLVAAPGATEATFAQQPPASPVGTVPVRSSAFCPRRIALVAAALVLLGGGYYAYRTFFAAKPAAPVAAPAPTPAPAPAPAPASPTPTVPPVAQIPAKLITKAQDTVAAQRASEQSRVDQIVAGREPTPAPVTVAPAPLPPPVKTVAPAAPVPMASLAFRAWVEAVKITGVRVSEGAPARAIINGRLARAEELMDANLGVVFDRVDIEHKQVIFRDRSGATVGKSY